MTIIRGRIRFQQRKGPTESPRDVDKERELLSFSFWGNRQKLAKMALLYKAYVYISSGQKSSRRVAHFHVFLRWEWAPLLSEASCFYRDSCLLLPQKHHCQALGRQCPVIMTHCLKQLPPLSNTCPSATLHSILNGFPVKRTLNIFLLGKFQTTTN